MIIGINGYALSGKDTIGEIIKQLQPDEQWEVKKFAGKLKEVASMILGIPASMFEDQQFKKKELPPMWSNHGLPMTVRDFLQKLGTDAMREGLHPNTWVNAVMVEYTDQNWIITDVRFPNEAAAIKNAGGIIVRVDRPGYKPINDHPSEVVLDTWNFDYRISNDGTIDDLKEDVQTILKQVYEDTPY